MVSSCRNVRNIRSSQARESLSLLFEKWLADQQLFSPANSGLVLEYVLLHFYYNYEANKSHSASTAFTELLSPFMVELARIMSERVQSGKTSLMQDCGAVLEITTFSRVHHKFADDIQVWMKWIVSMDFCIVARLGPGDLSLS